jgi:hypothetical protein
MLPILAEGQKLADPTLYLTAVALFFFFPFFLLEPSRVCNMLLQPRQ